MQNCFKSFFFLLFGAHQLDSAWIVYNRPSDEDLANIYAGFLMALGLIGHMDSIQDYYLYGYFQDKHELTVVALLLGIAAPSSYVGGGESKKVDSEVVFV